MFTFLARKGEGEVSCKTEQTSKASKRRSVDQRSPGQQVGFPGQRGLKPAVSLTPVGSAGALFRAAAQEFHLFTALESTFAAVARGACHAFRPRHFSLSSKFRLFPALTEKERRIRRKMQHQICEMFSDELLQLGY